MKFFNKILESVRKKPLIWGASVGSFAVICIVGTVLLITLLGRGGIAPDINPDDDVTAVINGNNGVTIGDNENFGRSGSVNISSFLTSVVAEKTTGRVVETDTLFLITTAQDIDAERLHARLKLEAASDLDFELEFEVSKSGESTFLLRAASPLPEDSIVRLALLDDHGEVERRWAFQTAPIFKINSVLPSNESEWVPIHTGIEITFSAEVSPFIMADYFSMTKPDGSLINGHFERFRNTIVFVPSSGLDIDTVYMVNVKAGLPSVDGLELAEGREFSFKTRLSDSNRMFFRTGGGISETFIPGDPVVLEIYCSDSLADRSYDVNLYRFDNSAAYLGQLNNYIAGSSWQRDYVFDTTGLTSVYTSRDKLLSVDGKNSWSPSYILLPDNLEEGYYIAEVKTELNNITYRVQKLIQINPISVYASSLPNESLFFINDTGTGLAAENATVALIAGGVVCSGETDANGVVRIEIQTRERGSGILRVEYNGRLYLDLFDVRGYTERTPEENYFLHLYTDRETYRTTDEIHVWGVIIPRERHIPLPTDLNLYFGEETENRPIPITLSPDGTFTAVINLQNNVESWWRYGITLMQGDEIMARKRITIRDYVKPSYVFDIDVPFYAWMPHINPVDVSLTASFFEGTPAKNIDFNISCWNASNSEIALITDEAGYAEASLLLDNPSYNNNAWQPANINAVFVLSGIENEYQRKTGSFFGLFRDVMLESEYSAGTLNITTSLVDPTNFVPREEKDNRAYYGYNYGGFYDYYYWYYYSWGSWGYDYADILRGAPADVTVTGTLHRNWTDKIETGTYYDFIQKRNMTSYRYESRTEVVGTFAASTSGGRGAFENLPVNIPDSWYYIELEWLDTRGQLVQQTVYLYERGMWDYWWRDDSIHSYRLASDSRNFTEGQRINFELEDNGAAVNSIPANGRIFYAVSGSEFITTGISNSANFNHVMTDEYVPNVYISGAYFNGRHVFPLAVTQYLFNSSEREILIDITTDKDRYRPAENATVTITARDLQGRIVPDARVSLSVVDEAAFAVEDQNINTLRMLYAYIYIPWVNTYHSYVQHSLFGSPMGEKGGGGDGDTQVRRNFKDNAAFLTGTTDSNGRATFVIDLPDNLTSWRLTAQVVGENADGNLCAGNIKQPLIVSIPLFLTVNSLPEYIYGDDITVSARINGQNISGNPQITAKLTAADGAFTGSMEATALSDAPLSFGKLPIGMYTLLVSASDGVNSDAIELPLEVVESLLETPVSRTFNLAEFADINPLRYPVSLTFYDNQYTLYSEVLSYMFRGWGDRADYRVARAFAQLELEYIDQEWRNELISDIATTDGLIRLLPYGEGELPLSALIAAAAPDVVNRGALTRQFYSIVSGRGGYTAEETTYAYLGLAALNEPVLTDILSLLENPEGLDTADKLRLIAGLALLGDEHNALRYYLPLTESMFRESGGHINIGSNSLTALALLTAGTLNLPEAEGMVRFLMAQPVVEQTFVLELMTYLRYYNPKIEGSATFTYNLYGNTETVTLNRFRGTTLRLGKEQLENANFTVTSGDVGVRAFYIGSISDIEEEPVLTVTKTYTLEEGAEWIQGALVRVTISVEGVQDRWISIEDVIPSGARYAGQPNRAGGWIDRSLQRINGGFSTRNDRSVSYLIRLVNSGEFVTESAVARDHRGNWGLSERGVIVIE
jgi:hypothetical protein